MHNIIYSIYIYISVRSFLVLSYCLPRAPLCVLSLSSVDVCFFLVLSVLQGCTLFLPPYLLLWASSVQISLTRSVWSLCVAVGTPGLLGYQGSMAPK